MKPRKKKNILKKLLSTLSKNDQIASKMIIKTLKSSFKSDLKKNTIPKHCFAFMGFIVTKLCNNKKDNSNLDQLKNS